MGSSNLLINMSDEHKKLCEELEKQELDVSLTLHKLLLLSILITRCCIFMS